MSGHIGEKPRNILAPPPRYPLPLYFFLVLLSIFFSFLYLFILNIKSEIRGGLMGMDSLFLGYCSGADWHCSQTHQLRLVTPTFLLPSLNSFHLLFVETLPRLLSLPNLTPGFNVLIQWGRRTPDNKLMNKSLLHSQCLTGERANLWLKISIFLNLADFAKQKLISLKVCLLFALL